MSIFSRYKNLYFEQFSSSFIIVGDNPRKMRGRDTLVKTRSSVNNAMKFFHNLVLPRMSKNQIKLL